ncbi:hypothetical protein [Nonomuraea basaltis]|uniref:hypothetical protein n=1 Tax=Nonomuraea basaltis TaxID=2495887 RepID=UPI00110C4802|nr:hypothetical protein [Nonomuraea basaltis]TMR91299.1 hypothetical protein EJK15_50810 [Nonomuraea basaltis]
MPDPLCIGPCCQERDNNYTSPRMAEPGLAICRWGLARLRRDIQTTPALLDWLAHHIAPTGAAGERVSGSREAPVPVRLDILCMIQEGAVPYRGDDDDQIGPPSIPSTVKTWAWLLCEHRGIAYQARATVAELAGLLARHAEWCATRPWIDDMMADFARLRRCAHGLAPWSVHVQRLGLPCWRCGAQGTLTRTAGESWIECDSSVNGCGCLWSFEEHQALAAAASRRLPVGCPNCGMRSLLRASRIVIGCDRRLDGCGRRWTQSDLTGALAKALTRVQVAAGAAP